MHLLSKRLTFLLALLLLLLDIGLEAQMSLYITAAKKNRDSFYLKKTNYFRL